MPNAEATTKLINKIGLHARPAVLFVQTASKFKSKVLVHKGDKQADAKSILGVLQLGAEHGTVIRVTAEGEDAEEAVKGMIELVRNRFHE